MAIAASPTTSDIRNAWDAIAPGYDEFVTPSHFRLGQEVLERTNLAPGMSLLDVAAGSGGLSIPAARLGAHVLATDLSPTMVERLRARAQDESLGDFDARVMDGHELDLPDNTFDVAGSQFGVMLFPDLPRAVRELARVTKPGGQVVLVVFGPPTQVDFLTLFMGAMQTVVPGFSGLPTDPPPLEFQVSDPSRLRERLAEAGLEAIEIESITERLQFGSGRQVWDWVTNSNPIGARLVADLSEQQKEGVREALEGLIRQRAGDDGAATLSSLVYVAMGQA